MALDLADKTANANNLTNHGATEYTASLPFAASTEAVQTDSSGPQNLTASDSVSLSVTNNFTIESWVNFGTLPVSASTTLVDKSAAYKVMFHPSLGLRLFTFPLDTVQVAWSPSTDTWYHIAVTFASNQVKFYVNGTQQGTTQTAGNASTADTANDFTIGTQSGDEGVVRIDEVRLWSIVRTQSEINNNKAVELTGLESNLNAYYPFESALGTTTSTTTSTSTTTTSTSSSTSTTTTKSTSTSTTVSVTTSTSTTTTSTSTSTTTTRSTSTSTSTTTTSTSTSTTSTSSSTTTSSSSSSSTTTSWPYPFIIDDGGATQELKLAIDFK